MSDLLAIYLNDHLAGATVGSELSRRALGSNRGTPLGVFLEGLHREIEEDRRSVLLVMSRLGVRPDRVKKAVAWLGERAGRLKPNGQLRGYSPLSRLVELEGLCLGVEGKLSLWRSLEHAVGGDPRLAGIDFESLARRAEAQRESLEAHRVEAARTALGGRSPRG